MKALLASVAALSALAMAAPASAHEGLRVAISSPSHSDGYAYQSARQLERLRLQVRQGIRYGAINNWEARRLFGRIHEVENLRYFYLRTRGMSPWEARDLSGRIQQLRFEIRREFWDGRSYSRFDDRGFEAFDGRDVRDHRGDYDRDDHDSDDDGPRSRR